MGISGLLPQLKSIMSPIHIRELRGQCVAVDTYSWLHKGALSCSRELCKGLPTSRHIHYCMHRVNLLRHYGVKPLLVFDGGLLPMKADQEAKRSRTRKENLERALEHDSAGNSAAAYECYQKAVDISPAIAFQLIQVLKKENVDYIVAPYEADAQMAFLSINNHVHAVITEDSDLIPFGCSRIIFKMDKFGQGVEFRSEMLSKNKDLSFFGFTKMMFLEMCIFSGCDYLQSLPGMGLKKAYTLIQNFKSSGKAIKHLRFSTVPVPPEYEDAFKKAVWTFQYQRVYDPNTEDVTHLSDVPDSLSTDCDFLGPWLPQSIAKGIAKGGIDPITKMPFMDKLIAKTIGGGHEEQEAGPACIDSINKASTTTEFNQAREKKKLHLPVQKNTLTNYFCLASIQAKRKFKAPQTKPSSLAQRNESSPCSVEGVSQKSLPDDDAAFSTDGCRDWAVDGSKDKENKPLDNENLGNPGTHSLFFRPKNDLYRPFLASHKKLDSDSMKETTDIGAIPSVKDVHTNQKTTDIDAISQVPNYAKSPNGSGYRIPNENLMLENEDHPNSPCESIQFEDVRFDILRSEIVTKKQKCNGQFEEGDGTRSMENVNPHSLTKGISLDCDLSHLDRYSGIAEESMKRFVSIISAFRYNHNNGSRVSGLRAPLKDVRNNSRNLSTTSSDEKRRKTSASVDLSKFAYKPKLSKHVSTSTSLKRP